MKTRKMRKQRHAPLSAQLFLFLIALLVFGLMNLLTGCASPQQTAQDRLQLPPALREVFRGGELTPLQDASGAELGMPSPYDLVSHTCVSTPIFGLDGRYVRTRVQCW